MENLFAKICFFKAHPLVNEILLDYATNMAILKREDFSNDIINPIEVNFLLQQNTIIFLQLDTEIYDPNSSNKSQEEGNDYKIAPDYETGLKMLV